jgi:3-oxoacyl-[acyl-carrier-protein] synthase III
MPIPGCGDGHGSLVVDHVVCDDGLIATVLHQRGNGYKSPVFDLYHDETVAWLVPHQANKRIIDATANRINLEDSKVLMNIERYGNTTSATLPLVLSDFEHVFKKGDTIIFAAFGGGFSWGSIYLKWAYTKD